MLSQLQNRNHLYHTPSHSPSGLRGQQALFAQFRALMDQFRQMMSGHNCCQHGRGYVSQRPEFGTFPSGQSFPNGPTGDFLGVTPQLQQTYPQPQFGSPQFGQNFGSLGQPIPLSQQNGNSARSPMLQVPGQNPLGQTQRPGGRLNGPLNVEALVRTLPRNRQASARQHFPIIIAEANRQGVQNKAQLAYILATATHESNAGGTMEERASGAAYEGRGTLGNTQRGDGRRFKGRGYVQVTGRRNYADWSRRTGVDLVRNPERAKEPAIAARILVEGMMKGTFTGKGLGSYINENTTDFRNARRTVNGTDRADHIANIAQRLLSAM